ncbi:MAG: PilX N-terminal domain-containing pilus assembly protein [Brachymonas sp.]|nr:PilX N-terminal domain-containing pilus assembly protein [Brachymonas sp.]
MNNRSFSPLRKQNGIALIFVLLLLLIAIGMVIMTARMTLSGSQASRNDRDRQIAFQAAELALNDAELDIMDINLTDKAVKPATSAVSTGRGCKLGNPKSEIHVAAGCGKASAGDQHGICGLDESNSNRPLYTLIDWTVAESSNDRQYVYFGEKTGRSSELLTKSGISPYQKPRYIIVKSPAQPDVPIANGSFKVAGAYKVYALGYGANKETQVMLESEIYKPIIEKSCNAS